MSHWNLDDIPKLRDSFIARTGRIPTTLHLPTGTKISMRWSWSMGGDVIERYGNTELESYLGMSVVMDADKLPYVSD